MRATDADSTGAPAKAEGKARLERGVAAAGATPSTAEKQRRRRRRATLRELGQEVRKPGGQSFFLFHFLPEMCRKSLSVPNSLVGGRRVVGIEGHQGEIISSPSSSCQFTNPNPQPSPGLRNAIR